jgi:hypothetical protein
MKETTFQFEEIIFKIFHHSESDLNESNYRGRHLIGTYYYDIHQPHNPTGEYHIHLRDRDKEVLSMNKGGSAHDGYHGVRIPNKAFRELKSRYPDWKWPSNRIIESIDYTLFAEEILHKLRKVNVMRHKNHDADIVESFRGFFHRFADDPFIAGGKYMSRTVALIETSEGTIRKVPVNVFRFIDSDDKGLLLD